jgi:hypothetical protein
MECRMWMYDKNVETSIGQIALFFSPILDEED